MPVQSTRISASSLPGVHVNRGNDLIDAGLIRSHDVDSTASPGNANGSMTLVLLDGGLVTLPLGGRSIEYMNGLVDAARAIDPDRVEHVAWR